MGNRSYLLGLQTPAPISYKNDEPALAAAKNCIPPFWFSLFDEDCIRKNRIILSDGKVELYPYLVTPVSDARQRLLARLGIINFIFPGIQHTITSQWVSFINQLEFAFIHLDPYEFCMMSEPLDDDGYFKDCVQAFELPLKEGIAASEKWAAMLDVAQIDGSQLDGNLKGWKLAGFSWGGPALPWETESLN